MTHDLVAALCWGVIGSVMVVAAGVTAMIVAAPNPLTTVVNLGSTPRHTHRDPTTGRYTRKEQ